MMTHQVQVNFHTHTELPKEEEWGLSVMSNAEEIQLSRQQDATETLPLCAEYALNSP